MKSNLKQLTSYILGATLVFSGVVFAGTLAPSVDTDVPNFVTLSDLYNKITLNTYSTSSHSVSTTSAPTASMYTLADIYNAIPTLSSDTITTGTTIMGIVGAYDTTNLTLGNVATGTAYGTSSVGTLVEARATEWYADDTPSATTTDWYTAGTTCAGLSSVGGTKDEMPWRLPSKDELVAKSTESHSNFLGVYYWSGTTYPADYSDVAYFVYISSGSIDYGGKDYPGSSVHCAR